MNWNNSKTLKDLTICPWCNSVNLTYKELFYSKSICKCNNCNCEMYETKLNMWYRIGINSCKVIECFEESLNKN
jgi:hypothetical protein